jgi:hypothetical protein
MPFSNLVVMFNPFANYLSLRGERNSTKQSHL